MAAEEAGVASSARKIRATSEIDKIAAHDTGLNALPRKMTIAPFDGLPPALQARARIKERVRSAAEVVENLEEEGQSVEVLAAESRTRFLRRGIEDHSITGGIDLAVVMKDLVLLDDDPDKGPGARKVVVSVLTMGYSMCLVIICVLFLMSLPVDALRPPKAKVMSKFPFYNWLNAAILHRVRLIDWPISLGLPPGMGFKSQEPKAQVWLTLRKSIEQGFLRFEKWSDG